MLALYIRVSTEEQSLKGYSLEAQEQALKEYAKNKPYKVYRDKGISARKPASKRPALQNLLADVQSGIIDMVCFIKIDRWFRNVKEYYKVQEVLDKYNVPWKAILEDYNTETADGRLKVNIMLSVAENEADRTSERIKFVFQEKKKKGEYLGNVPLGFKRENKKLVKDNDTSHIVELMFEHFFKYNNIYQLTREMCNRFNFPENSWYTWKGRLLNPVYVPEYITQKQHERILKLTTHGEKYNTKRTYLFTGLIFCECGKRMYACSQGKKNGNEYQQYRCMTCHKYLVESTIEKYVQEHLIDTIQDTIIVIEKRKRQLKRNNPQTLKNRLKRLNNAYIMGNIEDSEYKELTDNLKREIALCEKEIPTNIKELSEANIKDVIKDMTQEQKKVFYRQIIDKIIIRHDRSIELYVLTDS